MYPRLTINLDKIRENTEIVVNHLNPYGIGLTAITKGCAGNPEVAEAFLQGGACALGDSRIINLKELSHINAEKWLIKIPMISEAEDAVRYSQISLISEYDAIKALNDEAKRHGKKYGIILMGDIGDLREGWFDLNEFKSDLKRIKNLDYIDVRGVGTNTNCASGFIPEPHSFKKLEDMFALSKEFFGETCSIFSGGSSGSYYMVEDGTIPKIINNLRIGELLLFGTESSYGKAYDYLNHDVFKLEAEVIEIKNKPSKPVGKIGFDAMHNVVHFEDKGIRKRMIVAIGKQDLEPHCLTPEDQNAEIITASSDHLLIDITDSEKEYNVGDIFRFNTGYEGMLKANTSRYVQTVPYDEK